MKRLSIVAARKELGKLADEVKRTGQPVILTRRGRPIARISPDPVERGNRADPMATLRGSLELVGSMSDVRAAVRELRREGGKSLRRRGSRGGGPGAR